MTLFLELWFALLVSYVELHRCYALKLVFYLIIYWRNVYRSTFFIIASSNSLGKRNWRIAITTPKSGHLIKNYALWLRFDHRWWVGDCFLGWDYHGWGFALWVHAVCNFYFITVIWSFEVMENARAYIFIHVHSSFSFCFKSYTLTIFTDTWIS